MEDVIGMYESDAIDTLKTKGFNVEISYLDYQEKFTPYTVFDMFPKPFTKVKKNRIVELSVFKDKSTISVPNYIDLDLREVQKRVKKDKLILKSENIIVSIPFLKPSRAPASKEYAGHLGEIAINKNTDFLDTVYKI